MADIAELMRKLHKDKITVSIEWLEQCVGYIRQELRPPEARLLLEIQVIINLPYWARRSANIIIRPFQQ